MYIYRIFYLKNFRYSPKRKIINQKLTGNKYKNMR
ncbi:hypothetical protein Mgra_00008366 [Meloidogyne graminicola]|uniref:Uncharacterized protein n=1 Tax=Meloidogyne graminicola TaxID=189291 RepID=A0A8S9ZG30_9BILA|nr:hypothetical protein Mgra_00008366 [Meloidogyne graminicola]